VPEREAAGSNCEGRTDVPEREAAGSNCEGRTDVPEGAAAIAACDGRAAGGCEARTGREASALTAYAFAISDRSSDGERVRTPRRDELLSRGRALRGATLPAGGGRVGLAAFCDAETPLAAARASNSPGGSRDGLAPLGDATGAPLAAARAEPPSNSPDGGRDGLAPLGDATGAPLVAARAEPPSNSPDGSRDGLAPLGDATGAPLTAACARAERAALGGGRVAGVAPTRSRADSARSWRGI
jgi:hypothetical protein